MKNRKFHLSVILALISVLLSVFTCSLGYFVFHRVTSDTLVNSYSTIGRNMLDISRSSINVNDVKRYIDSQTTDERYYVILDQLRTLRRCDPDIEYLYVFTADEDGMDIIFDTDEGDANWPLGYHVEYSDLFLRLKSSFLSGSEVEPFYDEWADYGRLLTVYLPLVDANGNVCCYFGLDYSIESLLERQREQLLVSSLLYFFLCIVFIGLASYMLYRIVVTPIRELSEVTHRYTAGRSDDTHGIFTTTKDSLSIEVSELRASLIQMDTDISEYVLDVETARWESEHDGLTQLENRQRFNRLLTTQYCQLRSAFVVYIDINNLKLTNDLHGHAAGDTLICQLAKSLSSLTTNSIHSYRLGGDEFLLVFCEYQKDEAQRIFDLWYSDFVAAGRRGSLACELAVGTAFGSGSFTIEQLVEQADANMYHDKMLKKQQYSHIDGSAE